MLELMTPTQVNNTDLHTIAENIMDLHDQN